MIKKTRHAIWYDNRYGRNDGPPLYYFEQLKKLPDVEVQHLLPDGDLKGIGKFDYHWWVDWGEDAVIGRQKALQMSLPKDGGKTIYIASDTHLDDGYRFEKAKQFDYVFFNQKHAYDQYVISGKYGDTRVNLIQQENGKSQKVNYLPHAAEPLAYPHFEILKSFDLCFIGHMQAYHKGNGIDLPRIDVLDYMFKKFPDFYYGSRNPVWKEKNIFEDAAKKFCQSKVVFNISIGNDVNMRFFETLMTGSFLLTNWIPELASVEKYGFTEGTHYVSYRTLEDAERKARFYIENDDLREKIAKAGYDQALKTGTYKSRIEEVLKIVG
jgi:hypothetical protein